MEKTTNPLTVYDGETLMDMRLEPAQFCVDTLLPQGVSMLGGASKIGKSWMVLDLCVKIAKGECFLDLPTTQGTTLYLCLEDTLRRVQERLNQITDEVPHNAFFAVGACTLEDGLTEQIEQFKEVHPDQLLPQEMLLLLEMMQELGTYTGSNSQFADAFNERFSLSVSAKGLKQMMNRWRYTLEDRGLYFESRRSNGQRILEVHFSSAGDESDGSDENIRPPVFCVPSVPCDPEKNEGKK